MRRLLDFLYKHLATLVFIILETLAVLLLCDRNNFSRSVIARHALTVQAHLNQVGTSVGDYLFLNTTNQRLSDENALLRAQLASYKNLIDSLHCDSLLRQQTPARFTFTSARVVYASLRGYNNYVIIDRGAADGIEENMGVIANGCAYGIVGSVAPHYSTVLLLINTSVNVSAKVGNDEQIGVIGWNGESKDRLTLDELPSHIHVKPGDSIFTSSFSTIFPDNIFIGKASAKKSNNVEGFNHILVNIETRYDKVRYVAVIRNIALPEYQQLIDEMLTDETLAIRNHKKETEIK